MEYFRKVSVNAQKKKKDSRERGLTKKEGTGQEGM